MKAIIIGASSGIGRALAIAFSSHGYEVGLAARRIDLLQNLQKELQTKSYIKCIDVSKTDDAMNLLQDLITEMGTINVVVISSGVGFTASDLDWEQQKEVIEVDVLGFTAMAHVAIDQFIKQGAGHLVGISSVAALRAIPYSSSAYSASKSFVSRFLQGMRSLVQTRKLPIYVTDVMPGYVDTAMIKDVPNKFWVTSTETAAKQIYAAIVAKRQHVYISRRWRLFAWVLKLAPQWLVNFISSRVLNGSS